MPKQGSMLVWAFVSVKCVHNARAVGMMVLLTKETVWVSLRALCTSLLPMGLGAVFRNLAGSPGWNCQSVFKKAQSWNNLSEIILCWLSVELPRLVLITWLAWGHLEGSEYFLEKRLYFEKGNQTRPFCCSLICFLMSRFRDKVLCFLQITHLQGLVINWEVRCLLLKSWAVDLNGNILYLGVLVL